MRSIGRVEAPRWLSDKFLKAAGARTSEPIEIFWGNPMPGTANGREPGKKRVHHDLCPFARGRGGRFFAYRAQCAHTGPRQSLG